jgi:D-threo-aldose 1-dehydrogenase
MQTDKQVGKTSMIVPPIGFGSASIANLFTEIPENEAIETIQYALETGINFIDTAPHYGAGLAEDRIGLALRGIKRENYTIETKIGRLITSDGERVYDYSRDGVLRSLEASLKRMNVDYVDSLLVHDPDAVYDTCEYIIEETFPVLADLRRQGIVKAIGVGINSWEMLVDFAQQADFDCFMLAGRYTLLEQHALKAMNKFNEQDISILAAGVFNTGILAKGTQHDGPIRYQYQPASPEIIAQVKQIEALCDKYNVALPAASLQFVAAHPSVASLVIGMKNIQQIQQTMTWMEMPIPDDFWRALRENKLIDADAPLPIDTESHVQTNNQHKEDTE